MTVQSSTGGNGKMTTEEFCDHYPKLYHMAEEGAYDSICKHGLLSTTGLLDLYEVEEPRRSQIERSHRPQNITLTHPTHGKVVIRDQKPMSDARLLKCLTGATPSEWYYLLNGFTFFWVSEERLSRLLGGRAYRRLSHCVLEVESSKVLGEHAAETYLTPMNTGNCLPVPHPRSPAKFVPLADCPFAEWAKKRGEADAVVECAIRYGVPNFGNYGATMRIQKSS